MKGLYCRAGVSDTEPKFVIQETVSLFVFPLQVDGNDGYYNARLIFICNYGRNEIFSSIWKTCKQTTCGLNVSNQGHQCYAVYLGADLTAFVSVRISRIFQRF